MASTSSGVRSVQRRSALVTALLLLCFSGVAPSQSADKPKGKPYALIYGTVYSPDNHVVPGIPIKIQRVGDKKPKWERTSDSRGEFAQRVPPGENDYLIIADIKVPKGGTKPQTKVHIIKEERVDISLHLGK